MSNKKIIYDRFRGYTEMDEHEEMQEENRIEKELERKLERASNCTCGAYQIIGMVELIQTADCCCGADQHFLQLANTSNFTK